jgi:hypothetical protein
MRYLSSVGLMIAVVSCYAATQADADRSARAVLPDRPTGYDRYQVVRIDVQTEADLQMLRSLLALGRDFELWSEVAKLGPVEVRVAPAVQALLAASGLRYEVTVPDLQPYLDEKLAGPRDRGFFDQLRTYQEHVQFMFNLTMAHMSLCQMVNLGYSVQGRAMWALRITGPGYTKPAVFYHGAEHGNEQAPASVIQYVANYLLTNYATDPDVAGLVDNVEWYLMPVTNPDGYVAWERYNANGVDLNRNWGGPGSGQDPSGGPYPFSEPETQHMRDFLIAHPNVMSQIDLHGYVPWIMWPWGHIPDPCPDDATFLSVGTPFRDLIIAAGGGTYDIGSIYNVAYWVSGSSTNYTYGVLDRWAFGIEVIDDDMPNICNEFLNSMVYVGGWLRGYDCNSNHVPDADDIAAGTSTDLNGNAVPDECEGLGDLNCNRTVGFDDINAFVMRLSDPATYSTTYPNCPDFNGDINGDGGVDFGDINPFVTLMVGT